MKTTSNFLLKVMPVILIMTLIGVTLSCSNDDGGDVIDDTSGCEELLTGLNQELADAATTFSQNPTEENCNAYKNVALNFLDELEACAVAAGQFDAVQEAAQEVSELDCTQFE
ncbi:MAG: hypothetical protein GVY05_11965 [Bacteroidetes bacterium]|nr:hypothetical protein [Bacteroidota bacterium]